MTAGELATLRRTLRDVRRRIASGTASAADHALVPALTESIRRGRIEVDAARQARKSRVTSTPPAVPPSQPPGSRGTHKPREVPSRIREIIAAQQVQLRALDKPYAVRLRKLAAEAQKNLTAALRTLAPGRFSAQQTRVVLAQVRGVVDAVGAQYGIRMSAELRALSVEAGSIGRESLLSQVDEWGERYTGSVRAIARVDLAAEQLRPALLEYHSAERYSAKAITDMRDVMARGSLSGESLIQTADAMAGELQLTPYQAERIVRTEASRAMHIVQSDDMVALFGEDAGDDWLKQLVTTFDDRTGQDSKFVHGQAVALDGLFKDNQGREYELPPNRPNDREAVVHVPKDAPIAGSTPAAEAVPTTADGWLTDDLSRQAAAGISDLNGQGFTNKKAQIRQWGRRPLAGEGLAANDPSEPALPWHGAGKKARETLAFTETPGPLAVMSFEGTLEVSRTLVSQSADAFARVAKGAETVADLRILRSFVHEEIHDHGPAFPLLMGNYRAKVLEEAVTETLAVEFTRRKWGDRIVGAAMRDRGVSPAALRAMGSETRDLLTRGAVEAWTDDHTYREFKNYARGAMLEAAQAAGLHPAGTIVTQALTVTQRRVADGYLVSAGRAMKSTTARPHDFPELVDQFVTGLPEAMRAPAKKAVLEMKVVL